MVTIENRKCRFILTSDNQELFICSFDDNNNPLMNIPSIMQEDLDNGIVSIVDKNHDVFITDNDITTAQSINEYPYLRKPEYGEINVQLDMLFHDVNNGLFGDNAKTGTWFNHVKSIKEKYPKNNN
jgi:hypothetical protein